MKWKEIIVMGLIIFIVAGLVLIPFIVMDTFVINWTDSSFDSQFYLVMFLCTCFVIESLVIDLFLKQLLKVLAGLYNINIGDLVRLLIESGISYIIITVIDRLFGSVELFVITKLIMVMIHNGLSYVLEEGLKSLDKKLDEDM